MPVSLFRGIVMDGLDAGLGSEAKCAKPSNNLPKTVDQSQSSVPRRWNISCIRLCGGHPDLEAARQANQLHYSCGTVTDLHRTFPLTSVGCSPTEPIAESILYRWRSPFMTTGQKYYSILGAAMMKRYQQSLFLWFLRANSLLRK